MAVATLIALGAMVLAACGSPSSAPPSTTSTTAGTNSGARNLTVTPAVKTALVAAFAAAHSLPASDYTGLAKGKAYYAYDGVDRLYWAGAQVIPSTSSMRAQVSVQDDGAYGLFTKPPGGAWRAYNDGLGGLSGTVCAVVVPPAVRTVWSWSPTTPCGVPPSGV
jgi:hypothetical protein